MRTFYIFISVVLSAVAMSAYAGIRTIKPENISVVPANGYVSLNVDFNLDSVKLKNNQQFFITPVIIGSNENTVGFPSVLVNGRSMQIAYERGSLKGFKSVMSHDIYTVVERKNNQPQNAEYANRIPLEDWMITPDSYVTFVYDSCACGIQGATTFGPHIPVVHDIAKDMIVAFITPEVTQLPIQIHNGRARVQFEVDKTLLHESKYICKNGQHIDNTSELKMINDSIRYALTDPNVEIARIEVCGFASPESPYLHNDELATGRSRALAEYIARSNNIPSEKTTYSAVPENWKEFRAEVLSSNEISEQQRTDLIELIDRPVYGPSDYDKKEEELKHSPKFARLYKNLILPKWFPKYRATTFSIQTHLKPMGDGELAKVFESTPEKMSLNQMFRVARLYPTGSREFNDAIAKALAYYPNNPVANLNVAASLVSEQRYEEAIPYLENAGNEPEVDNLKGIIASSKGDYSLARDYFEKAKILPEAARNLQLIPYPKEQVKATEQ